MIWYFAYGSNLDQDRFRERVRDWTKARPAVLHDHALRFSGEVSSEGGGGAIIVPAPGERVYGGIYAIGHDQIAVMDDFELHSPMNVNQRGVRRTVRVDADGDSVRAEVYEVPAPAVYRAPSDAYLGHITKGLRDFGYDDDVIAAVEAVAASEPAG